MLFVKVLGAGQMQDAMLGCPVNVAVLVGYGQAVAVAPVPEIEPPIQYELAGHGTTAFYLFVCVCVWGEII